MSFTHLNIRSEYSLVDGSIKIKKLVKSLSAEGYTAAALTDSDAMHGAIEFYTACQSENIKPIIGISLNISSLEAHENVFKLLFLVTNEKGYTNLSKLEASFELCVFVS